MTSKFKLAILIILALGETPLKAQNNPVFSQFYANPYQFNPSFVASNGYTEVNIQYRQQWLGISNAPRTSSVNFQAPIGRNVSLGVNAYSDKSILLTTNSVLATFGYKVRLGNESNLNFGLSAGTGFNNFDLSALDDLNDPALKKIEQDNIFFDGQFGVNYKYKNLTVGFALPKIFESNPNSSKTFNTIRIDQFQDKFGSVSYTLIKRNFEFTPILIYRALDSQQDQWEGVLVGKYRDIFWLGASYRTNYGITAMIGFNIKGLLKIGYSYEYPTADISQTTNGSHEVYLGARIGNKNREFEVINTKKDSISNNVVTTHEPIETEVRTEPIVTQEAVNKRDSISSLVPAPEVQNNIKDDAKQSVAKTTKDNYYVVIGVYKNKGNAIRSTESIKIEKVPMILFEESRDLYFVYTFVSDIRENAVAELKKLKQQSNYSDAWLYVKNH